MDVLEQSFSLKNDQVLLSIEAPGGIYNATQLKKIATVCDGAAVIAKATEDQRLALVTSEASIGGIEQELASVGLGLRRYQEGLHQAVTCIGKLCNLHAQDAMQETLALNKKLGRLQLESPLRIGINGCPKACVPTQTLDISIVGEQGGYRISLGGKATHVAELASFMAEGVPAAELPDLIERVIDAFVARAVPGSTLYSVMEEHGVAPFAAALAPYSQDALTADPLAAFTEESSADLAENDLLSEQEDIEIDESKGDLAGSLEETLQDDTWEVLVGDTEEVSKEDAEEVLRDDIQDVSDDDVQDDQLKLAEVESGVADLDQGELEELPAIAEDFADLSPNANFSQAHSSEASLSDDDIDPTAFDSATNLPGDVSIEDYTGGSSQLADSVVQNALEESPPHAPEREVAEHAALSQNEKPADPSKADFDQPLHTEEDEEIAAQPQQIEESLPAELGAFDDPQSETTELETEELEDSAVSESDSIELDSVELDSIESDGVELDGVEMILDDTDLGNGEADDVHLEALASSMAEEELVETSTPLSSDPVSTATAADDLLIDDAPELNDADADAFEERFNASVAAEESMPIEADENETERLEALAMVGSAEEISGSNLSKELEDDLADAHGMEKEEFLEDDQAIDAGVLLDSDLPDGDLPDLTLAGSDIARGIQASPTPDRESHRRNATGNLGQLSGFDVDPTGTLSILFDQGMNFTLDPEAMRQGRCLKVGPHTIEVQPIEGGVQVVVDGLGMFIPQAAA